MARPREQIHCASTVILRALVLIAHHHADWGAERDTEFGTGLDLDAILLVARRRERALAGTTSRHLRLDVGFGERHSGGHAVDDAADGAAMRLAIAERVLAEVLR